MMFPFFAAKKTSAKQFIHGLDPRIKLLSMCFFILAIIFTPYQRPFKFMMYFLLLLLLTVVDRIPLKAAFGRLLLLGPFLLFLGLSKVLFGQNEPQENLNIIWNITVKSGLTFLSLLVLTLTTDFYDLIKSLELFKLPRVVPALLAFAYRYSFLFLREAKRMWAAKEARTFGKRKKIEEIKTLTRLLPRLFLRVFDRSERIYAAMLARGYKGTIQTLKYFKLQRVDFFFIILFLSIITVIWVWP